MSIPTKSTESAVDDSVLPPGQRDPAGFWYPEGYSDPKNLVRTRRRRRKDDGNRSVDHQSDVDPG